MSKRKADATPTTTPIEDDAQYRAIMARTVEHRPGLFLLKGHEVLLSGAVLHEHIDAVRTYEAV